MKEVYIYIPSVRPELFFGQSGQWDSPVDRQLLHAMSKLVLLVDSPQDLVHLPAQFSVRIKRLVLYT